MSPTRSVMTCAIASAVPIGSSKRRSTRGNSTGTTGTIGSPTTHAPGRAARTVFIPSRRASGPRGIAIKVADTLEPKPRGRDQRIRLQSQGG